MHHLEARYRHDGIATTAVHKLNAVIENANLLGIVNLYPDLIPIKGVVGEPVDIDPVEVGLGKAIEMRKYLNKGWIDATDLRDFDTVNILDVLPVVQNLRTLEENERVMKKPEAEEGSALNVFTSFFARIQDALKEEDGSEATIDYYLIMARMLVDKQRGLIKENRPSVGFDKVRFVFSRPLIALLADPDNLKDVNYELHIFDDILSMKTVRACKMQTLVPLITQIAALRVDDEFSMRVIYKRGGWDRLIDRNSDLRGEESRIGAGVKGEDGQEVTLPLVDFVRRSTQNSTPYLVRHMMAKYGTRRLEVVK